MDGLECSEILLSQVRTYDPFRIDSQFFKKKYICLKEKLLAISCCILKDLVSKEIQTGHTPSMSNDSFYGGNIALIKTDNLHDNNISTSFSDYLSQAGNAVIARTALISRDIITTIIGATEKIIARSAIVTEEYLPANINQNIVQVRIDPQKASPEYVDIYLNTKYGKAYLIYLSRQTEQFNLNCKEVESVLIPLFCKPFQDKISSIVQRAQRMQKEARTIYSEAEALMRDILCVPQIKHYSLVATTKMFSESLAKTARLDAEYYQPKYEKYTIGLNTSDTVITLCKIYDENFEPIDEENYPYIELSNIGRTGEIEGVEIVSGDELPTRARRKVRTGQVIVSSIEGSLQNCALIPPEYDEALCSTGFYVLDSDFINPETLLVLFKSEPIQSLMKQRCSGTILTGITKDEFLSMPLPKIDSEVQEQIATIVQQAFSFRKQSEQLLDYAKEAVELAIEQGEDVAMAWLKDKVE